MIFFGFADGSAGYSIAEYDTFARHGAPVIGLIGNDACWTQIEREQVPMFKADTACPLEYSAYERVVDAFGGKGYVIRSPRDDIRGILRQAQEQSRNGTSVLVNALIGSTNFREGSLSV